MAELSKIEQLIELKARMQENLVLLQENALKAAEKVTLQEQTIVDIEKEIEDLRNPKNPVLKAFAKVGEKASNVIRNVRLSVMSEEDLKQEYQVYKRVNDSLGKGSVPFDTFKESPEDYVEGSSKPNALKNLEDYLGQTTDSVQKVIDKQTENLKQTQATYGESVAKIDAVVHNTVDKAKDTIEKNLPSLKEKFSNGLFSIGKHAQDLLKTAQETYAKAAQEVAAEAKANGAEGVSSNAGSEKDVEKTANITTVADIKETVTVVDGVESKKVDAFVETKEKAPTKKPAARKNGASKPLTDEQKAKVSACRKVFNAYRKVVDNNTEDGKKPDYNFEDYKAFTENEKIPKEHQLNKVSFTKAVKVVRSAQAKKLESTQEITAPAPRRKVR